MLDKPSNAPFLQGTGELGRLIAEFDWSQTPLGPIADWSATLRAATSMVLRSPMAMVLMWGRHGTLIYNAGYAAICGSRHPGALGATASAAWPEVVAFNGYVIETCLAGGVLSYKNQRLTLFRNDVAEDVWLDLAYSPIVNGDGNPEAVLAVVVDTTARFLADERLRIAQQAGRFGTFEWFPHQQRLVVSDAYREIYGLPAAGDITDSQLLELMPEDDRQRSGNRRLGNAENPLAYAEYRIRHGATGELRWIARRGEILSGGKDVEQRFIGVAWDITDKKRAELNDAFLASVSDRMRNTGDPNEVLAIATAMLGGHLGAGRVGYGDIVEDKECVDITHEWTDGATRPMAGRHRLEIFGAAAVQVCRSGETLRVDDCRSDARLADPALAEAYAAIGVRAAIVVPLIRGGRFVAAFYVHSAAPRTWDDTEVAAIERVAGRSWDAAQRALSEQRLRESEETFRLFAQSAPNMVWAADAEGRLFWFNDRIYAYTGAAPEDLASGAWGKFFHPDDRATVIGAWQEAIRHGSTYESEGRLRRADGEYRWHINRAMPVRGSNGQISRWIGTNTDIEEQRRTLADLARLNAILEERVDEKTRERDRIWSLSRDPLLIADHEGRWLSVSPAWTSLLGWPEEELVGRTAEWMAHPDDQPSMPGLRGQMASGTATLRFENRFRTRDGQYRWFSWTAVADDGLLYCVARDVTDEKEAAQRLRLTEEALRQAQKMEAIGQLTGGIAHDFNNLLTGIIGSLALIRRRIAAGRTGDIDRFMDAATTSAQRAAALTHRLLAFARRQSLDTKPVRVEALVQGMEELLRRTLGEQVRLRITLAQTTWYAMTDPNQLESAVLNLAINARDAMPEGGELGIATSNIIIDSQLADSGGGKHLQGLEPGGYVAIAVTDTGVGMPQSIIDKVFEPFFTTKPVGQGTGLGLSMVYGFARQSGGRVSIDSEPGHGTTVTLYLPRAEASAEQEHATLSSAPVGAGETVLVVEDNPAVRMLITEVLRDLGYRTLEASCGEEALPILGSDTGVDLLVSDVGLPGMSGRQIAQFARERRPALKILFVTGYAEGAAIRSGFLAPGMALITKPFDIETLASKVSDMMYQPPAQEPRGSNN